MTTLAERAKIEVDSQSDPASPPAGSTQQEVEAAIAFLARLRSAVIDVAQGKLEITPIPESGPDREAIAWARDAVLVPDNMARVLLRLVLAKFDSLTPAQFVATTDNDLITAVDDLVPTLAVGRDVRRT